MRLDRTNSPISLPKSSLERTFQDPATSLSSPLLVQQIYLTSTQTPKIHYPHQEISYVLSNQRLIGQMQPCDLLFVTSPRMRFWRSSKATSLVAVRSFDIIVHFSVDVDRLYVTKSFGRWTGATEAFGFISLSISFTVAGTAIPFFNSSAFSSGLVPFVLNPCFFNKNEKFKLRGHECVEPRHSRIGPPRFPMTNYILQPELQ